MSSPKKGHHYAHLAQANSPLHQSPAMNNLIKHQQIPPPSTSTSKKKPKICKSCQRPIIGTLVRALDAVYHIECFTCYDCQKPCSQKFFSAELPSIDNPNNLIPQPLCEYDYFKRIDLICHTCNSAIRGSYVTALGRKYHADHFFCDVCHKLFDSDDYYANKGKIFCHYHYSQLYAFKCSGCKSAILKQYVELNRGGNNQQWHPECFMVHKFWNVDVTVDTIGLGFKNIDQVKNHADSNKLLQVENALEKLTADIWCSLSEFEEYCASCISEMLHSITTCNKHFGLICTANLILKIEILFKACDSLNNFVKLNGYQISKSDSNLPIDKLSKESRLLSAKLLSYMTLLRDITPERLNDHKLSQDLLSLISTLAHYIKLISRTSIILALDYNKISESTKATGLFLSELSKFSSSTSPSTSQQNEQEKNNNVALINTNTSVNNKINSQMTFPFLSGVSTKSKDVCEKCNKSIEDSCALWNGTENNLIIDKRWHINCLSCDKCHAKINHSSKNSIVEMSYNPKKKLLLCASCASEDVDAQLGFKEISKLLQYIYLLKIALLRSKSALSKQDSKFKSNSKNNKNLFLANDDYNKKVNDITRRRSIRESRLLQNVNQSSRKSVILEAPIADAAGTEETEDNEKLSRLVSAKKYLNKHPSLGKKGSKNLRVEELPENKNKQQCLNALTTSKLLQSEKALTLDDIPRIVSTEQAREHRPNAFKYQKRNFSPASNLPPSKSVSQRGNSNPLYHSNSKILKENNKKTSENESDENKRTRQPTAAKATATGVNKDAGEISNNNPDNDKVTHSKRFSDLNFIAHEYLRHVAVFILWHQLPKEKNITLEEFIYKIEVYKSPSFWEKIFGGNSSSGGGGSNSNSNSNSNTNTNSSSGNNNNNNSDNSQFKSGSSTAFGSGNGVFGVPLAIVVEKYGVDSDLGVGTTRIRIPMLVDEIIHAMKTQDLSAEGVFRLNGNIRRLRELVEQLDGGKTSKPDKVFEKVQLKNETPIQLAALLKKFLRDLPIPLMTFKLYQLFLSSLKDKKDIILPLTYSMLPKINRDLLEVLLSFLSWVATFAQVDNNGELEGSKMDVHNLATVITPNIFYSENGVSGEDQFLAIEVINELIESHEKISIIPDPVWKLFKLAQFEHLPGVNINGNFTATSSKEKNDLNSKEIMNKLKAVVEKEGWSSILN